MNHQVSLLLKKFCELQNVDYRVGKRTYLSMNKKEKAQMVTAMRKTILESKVKILADSM